MAGFGQEAKPLQRLTMHTIEACFVDMHGNKTIQRFIAGNVDIAIGVQYGQAKFMVDRELERINEQGLNGQSTAYVKTNSEVVKKMHPDVRYDG